MSTSKQRIQWKLVYNSVQLTCIEAIPHFKSDNKQLLDEVEHDIMNYQNQGLCYNIDLRV